MDTADLQTAPPIALTTWDMDEVLGIDEEDFLGTTQINLLDANIYICSADVDKDKRIFRNRKNITVTNDSYVLNQIPEPKWHQIKNGFKPNSAPSGEVLCSFALIEDGTSFSFRDKLKDVNLSEIVQTKSYNVEINVLNLRSLQSFGILPIKKPFI